MRKLFVILFVSVLISVCSDGAAQCIPATSNCMMNGQLGTTTPLSYTFTFNNFSEYNGGETITGGTILTVTTQNNPGDTCHWKLRMYIHTNDASGTAWSGTPYGSPSGGTKPLLDLLQVRVYNYCGTAYKNLVLQNFTNVNDSYIDIIDDVSLHYPRTCNGAEVNTAGSYLTDYGEYSFNIDYVIKPGVIYNPGYYTISIRFCLTE